MNELAHSLVFDWQPVRFGDPGALHCGVEPAERIRVALTLRPAGNGWEGKIEIYQPQAPNFLSSPAWDRDQEALKRRLEQTVRCLFATHLTANPASAPGAAPGDLPAWQDLSPTASWIDVVHGDDLRIRAEIRKHNSTWKVDYDLTLRALPQITSTLSYNALLETLDQVKADTEKILRRMLAVMGKPTPTPTPFHAGGQDTRQAGPKPVIPAPPQLYPNWGRLIPGGDTETLDITWGDHLRLLVFVKSTELGIQVAQVTVTETGQPQLYAEFADRGIRDGETREARRATLKGRAEDYVRHLLGRFGAPPEPLQEIARLRKEVERLEDQVDDLGDAVTRAYTDD